MIVDVGYRQLFVSFAVCAILMALAYFVVYLGEAPRSLFELSRDYGPITRNLLAGEGFVSCEFLLESSCLHAHRMPLIPLYNAAIGLVANDVDLSFLLKHLTFFVAPIALGLWRLRPVVGERIGLHWLLLLCLLLLNPVFLRWVVRVDIEESFAVGLFFLLGCYVARVSQQGAEPLGLVETALVGVLLALILMIKSSYLYPVVVCAAYLCFLLPGWAGKFLLLVPVLGVLISWGLHSLHYVGTFSLGTSIDNFNLFKGNNEKFLAIYPRGEFLGNLDALDEIGFTRPPAAITEAALSSYYKGLVMHFVAENKLVALQGALLKFVVVFFDPQQSFNFGRLYNLISILSLSPLKLMVLASLCHCLWSIVKNNFRGVSLHIFVIFVVLIYAAPYVAGFGYQHHMFPLYYFVYPFAMIFFGSRLLPECEPSVGAR